MEGWAVRRGGILGGFGLIVWCIRKCDGKYT